MRNATRGLWATIDACLDSMKCLLRLILSRFVERMSRYLSMTTPRTELTLSLRFDEIGMCLTGSNLLAAAA